MKKLIIATLGLSAFYLSFGQTPEDALNVSRTTAGGTARTQALGGASGAIGGEISTIFSNPANIGFYRTGDAVISLGYNGNSTKGTYFGTTDKANKGSVFLGTSGIVLGRPSYRGGAVKSSAFGIAVNRTADYNNDIYYRGENRIGSMGQMWIEDVKAYGYNQFGSDLAYRTYWIDSANGGLYSPAQQIINSGGSLLQEQSIKTTGGITEFAIAGAANINEHVFLGATIGLPTLRYERARAYTEADKTTASNHFDYAYFDDELTTRGAGINVKAGIVITPNQNFRIGLAAHTPTFYSLTDHYTARAGAKTEGLSGTNNEVTAASDDGSYRNDGVSVSDYNLQTPYRIIGSFAWMLGNMAEVSGQKGFITADLEYVNYMSSKFTSSDNSYSSYFRNLNTAVKNAYQGALNARVGAELKFNTVMARIGGAYYGNPYKDIAGEKSELYQGTAGVGYRNRGFFVDLGFVQTFGTDVNFPYRLENRNSFQPASLKPNNSRVLLTLGFKI